MAVESFNQVKPGHWLAGGKLWCGYTESQNAGQVDATIVS